ncbi:MAG: DUF4443 domain-containing protein [Thermoproteota archaeon]
MDLFRVIGKVSEKLGRGKTPTFNDAHVVKAIETLGSEQFIGRKILSQILGLGRGETRTLVKHLREENLIEVSRRGMDLSKKGNKILSDLRSKISQGIPVPDNPLTVGPSNVAILVRDAAPAVRYGVEQRDTAIKSGARGATTLIFKNNNLVLPIPKDFFKKNQEFHDMLVKKLEPEEGDVVVIASAEDERIAELAAKTVALNLLKSVTQH